MFDLLKMVWRPIETALKFIGKVQSAILLSVAYFLVMGLIAIPLKLIKIFTPKSKNRTYWTKRSQVAETEITLRRQF